MAQTNLSIRIDEELKKDFAALCDDIGMSMTTAFCIFAKKAVRERRIPFELTGDPDYSFPPLTEEQIMERIKKGLSDLKNGMYRPAEEVENEIIEEFGL